MQLQWWEEESNRMPWPIVVTLFVVSRLFTWGKGLITHLKRNALRWVSNTRFTVEPRKPVQGDAVRTLRWAAEPNLNRYMKGLNFPWILGQDYSGLNLRLAKNKNSTLFVVGRLMSNRLKKHRIKMTEIIMLTCRSILFSGSLRISSFSIWTCTSLMSGHCADFRTFCPETQA